MLVSNGLEVRKGPITRRARQSAEMIVLKLTHAKARLPELYRLVAHGGVEVHITRRGKFGVKLVPCSPEELQQPKRETNEQQGTEVTAWTRPVAAIP